METDQTLSTPTKAKRTKANILARTKKMLADDGWLVSNQERWNPYAKVTQDLWGFCDLLCVKPGVGTRAIQLTSATNRAHRREKLDHEPRAATCHAAGWTVEIITWGKQGPRGAPKVWTMTREIWEPPAPDAGQPVSQLTLSVP